MDKRLCKNKLTLLGRLACQQQNYDRKYTKWSKEGGLRFAYFTMTLSACTALLTIVLFYGIFYFLMKKYASVMVEREKKERERKEQEAKEKKEEKDGKPADPAMDELI